MPTPLERAKSFLGTSRRFVRNAVQRRANPQAFLKNDLTPHGEILRDGLLSVRHYPRLLAPAIVTESGQVPVSGYHYRLPIVLAIYGIDAWQRPNGLTGKLSFCAASLVVSISQITLDRFQGWSGVPGERCAVLPNAIRAAEFAVDGKDNAPLSKGPPKS